MNDRLKPMIVAEIERAFVPQFELSAISARASAQGAFSRRKAPWVPALLIFAPVLAAAAAILPSPQVREAIVRQFRVWNVTSVVFQSGFPVTLEQARHDATFHLIAPSALPENAKIVSIIESDNGNAFTMVYALPQGTVQFIIRRYAPGRGAQTYFGRQVVMFSGKEPKHLTVIHLAAHAWIAGSESVVGSSEHLSANQFERVKRAMRGHDAPVKP